MQCWCQVGHPGFRRVLGSRATPRGSRMRAAESPNIVCSRREPRRAACR